MLARQVSMGHDNTGKSPQKQLYRRGHGTEEGMVKKRACKVTTCWVYKCTYNTIIDGLPDSV